MLFLASQIAKANSAAILARPALSTEMMKG
jgi:hypothetical protein